jgi:hypothetical protein
MPDAHDVNDHKVRGDLLTADDWNALARLAKLDRPASGGDELIPFELYEDIAPSETNKDAWILKDDLTRDTDADKIHVSDGILGDVRALGSNTKTGGTPATGARGYAVVGPDGDNQIVAIQRKAKMIVVANTASGHAAVTSATTSFTATLTRVCDDGQNPLVGAATSLTVTNPGFEIDDNLADITCIQDGATYRIVDAKCPA